MKSGVVVLGALLCSAPALAQQADPLAPLDRPAPEHTSPVPAAPINPVENPVPLPPPRVIPRDWPGVFAAIRAGDWTGAQLGIAALPDTVIKPFAKAELYTAKDSPKVELGPLLSLLAEAPELPQAEQILRLAQARGATILPPIVARQRVVGLGAAPRRGRARPIEGEPAADALRLQLDPLVRVDDVAGAEALFYAAAPTLSAEARAEAAQRVAWIHYVLGRDADARRVADSGRLYANGEWGAQAAWISGLASWRMGDCSAALASFRDAGRLARQGEMAAASHYWAARSAQACRRSREVAPLLKAAANSPESFYGLIARETLGMDTSIGASPLPTSLSGIEALPNIRRAVELVRMGERGRADELFRHQAAIGRPSDQAALIAVARKLDLAGTQFWLAHNGQPGVRIDPSWRYPIPSWQPERGWRIDPALAYAHVIQESSFRAEAVSPVGAVGLMQVRPETAGDTARSRGESVGAAGLKRPETNLDHGQAFVELIRASAATQGQLPKVIAAYNAGPVPVARWNGINDRGDPLLWMESIPYWETRYYVPAVLRNMWVYQGLAGSDQPTLKSVSEHHWPAFPTGHTRLRQ